MYQIAYIGRWETLPETAAAICDHDTPKLEALLQGGLDLGAPIQLSEYKMCIRDSMERQGRKNSIRQLLEDHLLEPISREENRWLIFLKFILQLCLIGLKPVSYTHLTGAVSYGFKGTVGSCNEDMDR